MRDAEEIHVTPKAFDRSDARWSDWSKSYAGRSFDQAPRVIPKTELHERLWPGTFGATLEDLKSKNGTKIGDATVTTPIALKDGDRITVGTVPLTYRASASGFSTETQASTVHPAPPPIAGSARLDRQKRHKP